MVSSFERSFIDQIVPYHAAGGDIDAPVWVIFDSSDGSDRVRIVDPSPETDEVATLLFCAAREGWSSAVTCCLERGADVNLREADDFWTALEIAAYKGHCDAAVLLLDAGARVDDRIGDDMTLWGGRTALHLAALHRHSKMCKLLLSRGFSLDARNNDGDDPEALARRWGHTASADFLAAVRAAGGWLPWLNAPREELLALRRRLPALRECGRAAPASSVRAHERLFLKTPDDVFSHVLTFWRSERDY